MGYTNFNPNASNTQISSTPGFFGGYEPRSYEDESGAKEAAPSESGSGMDTWRYGSPSNIRNWQTNQSQGRSGGGGSRKPMGSTSESSVTFEGEAPDAPKIDKLEVAAIGDVRRAKLYYLRKRVGKKARVRELRQG